MSEPESNPTRKDNGIIASVPRVIITITDVVNFKMDVGGSFPSLDYALNMLEQAKRELDSQWRRAKALQLQQELAERAQADAIAQQIRRSV